MIVANISGGKDSVAMCLRLCEEGQHVDEFVFADTGMEFPECYDAIDRFEKLTGRNVTRLQNEHDNPFEYYAIKKEIHRLNDKPRRDGTPRRNQGYGWPSMLRRWCTKYLKTNIIEKHYRGALVVNLIGIAADEPKRIRQDQKKRYPLVEWGMTESDCLSYCRSRGFYKSPCAYDVIRRVSCFCCPLMNLSQISYLIHHRPELWDKIVQLEKEIGEPFKEKGTKYYIDRFNVMEEK